MTSRRPLMLAASVAAAAVCAFWWTQSMMTGALLPDPLAPGAPIDPGAEPQPPSPLAEEALELSSRQRVLADTLAEAQRVELSDSQIADFEAALSSLRGTPAEKDAWTKLRAFERSFPLFSASEEALFACLRGRQKGPKACEPSPRYRELLDSGVRDGALSRAEADKYLEVLSSLKDPKVQPALPPGGLQFLEAESQTKLRNFGRIAEAVRRAGGEAR